MSDKELLELAAKAAGLTFNGQFSTENHLMLFGGLKWAPLTTDGDALRLAVKLNIRFSGEWGGNSVALYGVQEFKERNGSEPYAATRRAIVRAAAEIGRALLVSQAVANTSEKSHSAPIAEAE